MKWLITLLLSLPMMGQSLPMGGIPATAVALSFIADAFPSGGCFSTSCTTTNITTQAGDTIEVYFRLHDNTGSAVVTDTCNTGGTSDSYTLDNSRAAHQSELWHATAGAAGTCAVTVTYGAGSSENVIYAQQWRGAAGVTFCNLSYNGTITTATDNFSSGTCTPTLAGSYIFGVGIDVSGNSTAINAGTGYTAGTTWNDGVNYRGRGEYKAWTSGSVAATFTETQSANGSGEAGAMIIHP